MSARCPVFREAQPEVVQAQLAGRKPPCLESATYGPDRGRRGWTWRRCGVGCRRVSAYPAQLLVRTSLRGTVAACRHIAAGSRAPCHLRARPSLRRCLEIGLLLKTTAGLVVLVPNMILIKHQMGNFWGALLRLEEHCIFEGQSSIAYDH